MRIKNPPPSLTPFSTAMNPTEPKPAPPSASALDTDREPPGWEWDVWERQVVACGMSPEMATLGRAVIREAGQHSWCPQLRCLCSEDVLEELLRRAPDLAKRLCAVLLETDGLRFARPEDQPGGEWIKLAGFEQSSNW
jgi:hypothetical protein